MPARVVQRGQQVQVLNDLDRVVGVFDTPPGDTVNRVAVAANYAAAGNEDVIGVTSTASARTITLPLAASIQPGQTIVVKDESGGAATNNITIVRSGGDTIDGATSKVLNANFGTVMLYSDGASKWFSC